HYGTIPNAAPLDPANYHGNRNQRSAHMSGLLNRVLLSTRLEFLHKVSTLAEMVEDLGKDFRTTADALVEGSTPDLERMWNEVDADHYDLNTYLRETFVVFKSFLIALPAEQLGTFESTICDQSRLQKRDPSSRRRTVRNSVRTAFARE